MNRASLLGGVGEPLSGAAIPSGQKTLGYQIREGIRQFGNPYYPHRLVRVVHPDGNEETIAERDEER